MRTAPKRRLVPSLGLPVRGLAHAVIPKQTWIDRIVRGRAWIPMFGALLVAIVGMRVEVLKLSSRVGTQIEQSAALQSSNAALRSTVSQLSGNERIEALAERLGMVMPGPMDVHFVPDADGSHVQAAIKAIRAPDPSGFLTGLADERHADLTSTAAAADTSAVGVLAETVPGYSPTDTGVNTDPLLAPVGSDATTASTGSGGSSDPATEAGGTATSSSISPGGSTADSSAGSTGAAAGVGSGTADGVASGNGSDSATSTPAQSTLAPTSGSDQPPTTSDSTDAASGANTQSSSSAASSGSGTEDGSASGSTTGGTSLNG